MSSRAIPERAALVIAYGNPLRQDDAWGWHVGERLAARRLAGVEILTCHQLTPELAQPISQASVVVFVDARFGTVPGRVLWDEVTPDTGTEACLGHDFSPASLLSLAGGLFGSCPPAWIITVTGERFDHGTQISPGAQAAVDTAVRWIEDLLERRSACTCGPEM